jgi:uncharacterized iron-regulated protein
VPSDPRTPPRRRAPSARLLAALVAGLVWQAAPLRAQDGDPLGLELGDPARRSRTVPISIDTIVDTANGASVTPEGLATGVRDARLVLVGEQHTSREAHRVQKRVIEALVADGRRVLIGLEMFPYTEQPALDRWTAGAEPEADWVRSSGWYEHWGYHWRYYRDIFQIARERKLKMVALNAPRAVVSAVGQKGLSGLTPEQAKHLPPKVDVSSAEHMTLFKAFIGGGGAHGSSLSDDAWQRMLSAQATWDATMAHHAVTALAAERDPGTVMVVLVGSGHVAYGLGIERQARPALGGRVASVIPVPVRVHGMTQPEARASYANYVWGVPSELSDAYPALGVSTRLSAEGGLVVLAADHATPAARAGVKPGDVLVSFGGVALKTRAALAEAVAAHDWGDAADLVIRRGDTQQSLRVAFTRARSAIPPAP